MSKAFAGIRIVDFSQVIAGPFCAQQLALLGADVIKIEQPAGGDQGRSLMADPRMSAAGTSPMFLTMNVGKRSITLDLKNPAAREVVLRLVESADVVLENFKAGTMEKLGFGYEALRTVKPDLVYCSVSGYGQAGPLAGAAAYDGAIQAASGMMAVTGHPETGPTRAGFTVVDLSTGLTAAFAIAGALLRRKTTGEGQRLDVSMFDSALTMLGPLVSRLMNTGQDSGLLGNMGPALIPTADSFATGDGFILLTVLTDQQFSRLCEAIGREDLSANPTYATSDLRRTHGIELKAAIEAALASDSAAAWETHLGARGIPCSAINTLPQVVVHPQLAHRDVLMRMPGGRDLPDEVTLVGAGFMADADGPSGDRSPPALGEHTDQILDEIGYTEADIVRLREAGAV